MPTPMAPFDQADSLLRPWRASFCRQRRPFVDHHEELNTVTAMREIKRHLVGHLAHARGSARR